MERFACAILGAGPGGYVAAIRAAQLGLKTVLIEERPTLGGTCLNVGCIPSKVLLESSERYHEARHGLALHGVRVEPSAVQLDLEAMQARKERIVGELTGGIAMLLRKQQVTVLQGRGRLLGDGRLAVSGPHGVQEFTSNAIVLAMGSTTIELPALPRDGRRVLDSTDALGLRAVPPRLAVIGAGAIGLELGSVWARLGSQVTVIELLPRIAPFAEKQLSQALQRSLAQSLGMRFTLGTRVSGMTLDDAVHLQLADQSGATSVLDCDQVLVAVGRRPNTADCGLETAGVALTERGRVQVDAQWRTTAAGIYAIGDLIDGPMLAHKAEEEGIAVAELLAGQPGHVNPDAIPNVIYTAPELAQVGAGEEELASRGVPTKVGKFYFKANGRAKSLAAEDGLVKVIAHAETDRVLGVHILGPRASDLIAEAALALEFSASAEDLGRTCHAHPTLAEALKEAALAVDKRQIHA